jgi:hypothetical protein
MCDVNKVQHSSNLQKKLAPMEASIGQLKKGKESSLSELEKLRADMTSAVQKIQVILT